MPKRKCKEEIFILVEYKDDGIIQIVPEKKLREHDGEAEANFYGKDWYSAKVLFKGSEQSCRDKKLLIRCKPELKYCLQDQFITSTPKKRHVEVHDSGESPPTSPVRPLSGLSYSDFPEVSNIYR